MHKYLARIYIQGNRGTYAFSANTLDDIRTWANATGKTGDVLQIRVNGTAQCRNITI